MEGPFSKIGIAGLGVVGAAVEAGFLKRGFFVTGYDKFKNGGVGSFQDLVSNSEVIFLCLPTLFSEEMKEYDKTSIFEVCEGLAAAKFKGLVVLKSTVEPGTTDGLSKKHPELEFAHNPEFLTARSAQRDFDEQSHIVCGRAESCSDRLFEKLVATYKKHWAGSHFSLCKAKESESMKIMVNSFYACKVMLFNEYHNLCEKSNIDFLRVRDMMLQNGWINLQHTMVPGPDGQFGFGGACFPKDTSALLEYSRRIGGLHGLLQAAVEENKSVRKEK